MSLASSLQAHFGFPSFRAGQEGAIQSLLNRQHTLAIMPTGAGKSLIYQFAALQLEGITLVISPLIALMKDQVDALNRRGIPATFINSAITVSEQKERLALLPHGKYKLLYVAPERLRSVNFLQSLQSLPLSLLAVDEAHCISEWGHDFRPDYLHIAEARKTLGNPLTAALTATATPKVQSDIVRLLGLPESTNRIITGFNRPNLTLEVKYLAGVEAKFRALNELLSPTSHSATLIYTGTRRDAEEVAEFVRVVCKMPARHYHAGLLAEERARIQESFIQGSTPVIVATNAFGMGIDRADVRQVIHYALPGSLEAYYQEAGRAGRDGLPARAILLYNPEDRSLQEFFISSSAVTAAELQLLYRSLGNPENSIWMTTDDFSRRTDLPQVKVRVGLAELERIGALEHLGDDGLRMLLRKGKWDPGAVEEAVLRSKEHRRHREDQLHHMVDYAETNSCRRRLVLQHFGDSASPEALSCCDNCLSQKDMPEGARDMASLSHAEKAALVILDASRRLRVPVGCEKLAQILKGSRAQDILRFHYDKNVYYAKLAMLRQNQIEEMIGQLISLGYFKVIGGAYPVLSLTPRGEAAATQKSSIKLEMPQGLSARSFENKKAELAAGGTINYTAQLLAKGLTVEQIAQQRECSMKTIYGHCARLIEAGKLNVDTVIAEEIKRRIEDAIQAAGTTQLLAPIKNLLPEEVTYEMIRCVVASHSASKTPAIDNEHCDVSSSHIQYIVALGESKSLAAVPELIVALKSKGGNKRRLAASALGKIRSEQAVRPLMELLSEETMPQIRQYAVKALGNIGDARAIGLLTKIAGDEHEMYYTRTAARLALEKCHDSKSIPIAEPTAGIQTSPDTEKRSQSRTQSPSDDSITQYLSSSHPRPLTGPWHTGFALDFHSNFAGADWNRSLIGDLAYRLKYQSDASALPVLVDQAHRLLKRHPEMDQFDILIPVPSSAQRNFSPVHEFCKALSVSCGRPMQTFIMKTRQTKPQKEMHTLAQKRENIAGAFAANGDIKGKRILLVDDLFDSGATLEEITRLLLRHHANQVNVLALTRTIHADS